MWLLQDDQWRKYVYIRKNKSPKQITKELFYGELFDSKIKKQINMTSKYLLPIIAPRIMQLNCKKCEFLKMREHKLL